MAAPPLSALIDRWKGVTPDRVAGWVGEAAVLFVPEAVNGARLHILQGRGPDGVPWPRLNFRRPGEQKPGSPLNRTGGLARSITGTASGSTLTIQTDYPGARLNNYGGTIVPVNAHFLCIPKTPKAEAAKSPRNYEGKLVPRVNREKTRGVLLAEGIEASQPRSERDGWHVAFVMTVGPVEVPAREFMGFSDETVDEIGHAVADHVLGKWLGWGD
jgi:phage gpG-like protein